MTARNLLLLHLRYLVQHGEFEATVVCSPGSQFVQFAGEQRISVISAPVEPGVGVRSEPEGDLLGDDRLAGLV
jgi:hypothetical protein